MIMALFPSSKRVPSPSSFLVVGCHQLLHSVQRRARLEPLNLAFVECVQQLDLILGPIFVLQHASDRFAGCQVLQAKQRNAVIRAHFVVVRWVGECQRQKALLL